MKTAFTALLLLLALQTATAAPVAIEGRVVSIQDGDTLTLLDANHNQHRIRLSGIDAPEIGRGSKRPGQPYGQQSKQSLSDLAYGREARAECAANDRYGRKVCTVMVGALDVNLEQVRRGMAMVYRKYASGQSYFDAEAHAKAARRGLWADPSPVEPWTWRKQSAAN